MLVVTLMVLFVGCGGNGDSAPSNSINTPSSTDGSEPSQNENPQGGGTLGQVFDNAVRNFVEDDYDSSLSFDTLAREPDTFSGELVKYTGRVLQIIPFSDGDGSVYRIAVNGNSDDVIRVEAYEESVVDLLLEGDMANVYGVVYGEDSYTAVSGATIYLPCIIAVKIEEVDTSNLIEYINEPFTVTELSYRGEVRHRTTIESFVITSVELSYSGDFRVNCEVIGKVDGYDYLRIEVKCYDEDEFILGSKTVSSSVADGERFKINESFYAPEGTVKIEFVKD